MIGLEERAEEGGDREGRERERERDREIYSERIYIYRERER